MLIVGCTNRPNTAEVSIDPNLPTINEVRTLSDMSEVGLEWTPIYDENIQGYYIYRSSINNSKLSRVATLKDRYASHYVDKKLNPDTTYNYAMSVYAKSGKESKPSPVATIATKPLLDAIPFVQAITDLPKRVKVIWRPHPYGGVTSYVVQKREIGTQKWENEKTIQGRLSAEYIDLGLDNNEAFEYRVMAKTDEGILSKPSAIVSAKTKPLPLSVEHIKATNDIPKKILLTWSPVQNASYYKVYSSPTSMLLFTYLAKVKDTKFEDLLNSNGTTRYYKVTAVDSDDLESQKQSDPIRGQTLAAPAEPKIYNIEQNGGQIILSWLQSDSRAKTYTIIKKSNGKKELITKIEEKTYVDNNVAPGIEYEYQIVAVDEYGLNSTPSDSFDISIPKEQY